MLRRTAEERLREAPLAVHQMYNEVLLDNLEHREIHRLLERRQAFIPVSPLLLNHALFEVLPSNKAIWVLERTEHLIDENEATQSRLQALKESGFRFAFHAESAVVEEMSPFMGLAEFFLLNVSSEDIPSITAAMSAVSKGVANARFMATNIQTHEAFQMCHKLQFTLFQGPFITRREHWNAPVMNASRVKILDLMNRVRKGAEQSALASQLKLDPVLSVRLMRYVNSPGMGLLNKVGGIEQALMVMGRDKLYRWLTMVLFTGGQPQGLDSALLENALVRARLAERLARHALPPKAQDDVFVTGLFSLLDIVLRTPMEQVLKQINLPEDVTAALLQRKGPFGPYLDLAIACEQEDQSQVEALAAQLKLEISDINEAQVDALIWAQEASET